MNSEIPSLFFPIQRKPLLHLKIIFNDLLKNKEKVSTKIFFLAKKDHCQRSILKGFLIK